MVAKIIIDIILSLVIVAFFVAMAAVSALLILAYGNKEEQKEDKNKTTE